MPVKVGADGVEGSVIGGYNCIRDYLYRYFDAYDKNRHRFYAGVAFLS